MGIVVKGGDGRLLARHPTSHAVHSTESHEIRAMAYARDASADRIVRDAAGFVALRPGRRAGRAGFGAGPRRWREVSRRPAPREDRPRARHRVARSGRRPRRSRAPTRRRFSPRRAVARGCTRNEAGIRRPRGRGGSSPGSAASSSVDAPPASTSVSPATRCPLRRSRTQDFSTSTSSSSPPKRTCCAR
jgi:hypothetical protein